MSLAQLRHFIGLEWSMVIWDTIYALNHFMAIVGYIIHDS